MTLKSNIDTAKKFVIGTDEVQVTRNINDMDSVDTTNARRKLFSLPDSALVEILTWQLSSWTIRA